MDRRTFLAMAIGTVTVRPQAAFPVASGTARRVAAMLAWDPCHADDGTELEGITYHVYRRAWNGGAWTRLTTAPIAATAYDDQTTVAVTSYGYAVAALSREGREGPLSAVVRHDA